MLRKIAFFLVLSQISIAENQKQRKHTTMGIKKHNFPSRSRGHANSEQQTAHQQISPQLISQNMPQATFQNIQPAQNSPQNSQGGSQNFPMFLNQGAPQGSFPQMMGGSNPQGGGFPQGIQPMQGNSQGPPLLGSPQGQVNGQGQGNGQGNGQGFPQGQGNGQGFPQGQGNGQGFPQGQGNGQGFPQGQGNGQGFPQGQGNGQGSPQGQSNPSDYYEGDYYYDDPSMTTINDAASFSKRQQDMATTTLKPNPAPPPNSPGPPPEKPKKKKKKKRPIPRRNSNSLFGGNFNNPFRPQVKLAKALLLPVRRPGWRKRNKQGGNNDLSANKNGTNPSANQTSAVQGKRKNGRNNNRRKKNKPNKGKNRRNKGRGTKKPPTTVTQTVTQSVTLNGGIAGISRQQFPRRRSTTPSPDEEYYEYYENEKQANSQGNGNTGNSNNGGNGGNNMPTNRWPSNGPAMGWGPSGGMGGSSASNNGIGVSSSAPLVPGGENSALNFCQSQNFNDAAHVCCSLPSVLMFDPDDMDECLEDLDTDNEPPSIEEYTLNRGLVGEGKVDFNAPSMKNLTDTILGDQPNSLDFDEMRAYIEANLNDGEAAQWLPLFKEASKNCSTIIQEKMVDVQDRIISTDSTCFTKPYLYIQCIKQAFLMACPKPSDRASSEFCQSSMSSMKQCNAFD